MLVPEKSSDTHERDYINTRLGSQLLNGNMNKEGDESLPFPDLESR